MKKNNEKKINWKKVAIVGGVFVLGAATGVIGGKMLLEYIIKNEDICIEATKCMTKGKPGVKQVMKCEKAGIALSMELSRGWIETTLDIIDGMLTPEKFFSREL